MFYYGVAVLCYCNEMFNGMCQKYTLLFGDFIDVNVF